jgi:hypothetical protein
MGKSNGQCHFCKNEIESLMHLFYRCHNIKHVLDELKHIFNSIFEKNIALVEENLIIGVYEGDITENLLLMNLVICILKWVICFISHIQFINIHFYTVNNEGNY